VTLQLAARLADDDPTVRKSLCFALGSVREPSLIEPLVGALDDSAYVVRVAALDGLVALDTTAVEPLVARARDAGTGRIWSLMGLERIGHDATADGLLRLAGAAREWMPPARSAFAKALSAHIDRVGVRELLATFAGDPDWRVEALARRALE
jgi:HEAT repeat protein